MFKIERKQRAVKHAYDGDGTWAISYGDMVTLLLAFFVLFFTTNPQQEKQKELQQSLVMSLLEGNDSKPGDRNPAQLNIGDNPGEGIEQKIIDKWGAKVYQVGHKILIEFPGVSFFKLGFIKVSDQGNTTLKTFAEKYIPYSGKYILGIRAFTDSRPVRSSSVRFKDNLELSALRSVSAMRTLRDAGIPLSRMKLGAYGELKVTFENLLMQKDKAEDKMSMARRIVLVIEPDEKKELVL